MRARARAGHVVVRCARRALAVCARACAGRTRTPDVRARVLTPSCAHPLAPQRVRACARWPSRTRRDTGGFLHHEVENGLHYLDSGREFAAQMVLQTLSWMDAAEAGPCAHGRAARELAV